MFKLPITRAPGARSHIIVDCQLPEFTQRASFVFVHGAWHDSRSWDRVVGLIGADGHHCHAVTLPGADSAGLSECCQDERTEFVIDAVRTAAAGPRSVILVAHSLGGITVSPVAEAVPELLRAVVYLSAFMLPPRMMLAEMMLHDTMIESKLLSVLTGHPFKTGALRLVLRDATRRDDLRATFYGDVGPAELESFGATLHEEEPLGAGLSPSPITRRRFGRVPRHYICCEQDACITPAAQRWMIASVDAAMASSTTVHPLPSSHSPFLSQPVALAAVLRNIVSQSSVAAQPA